MKSISIGFFIILVNLWSTESICSDNQRTRRTMNSSWTSSIMKISFIINISIHRNILKIRSRMMRLTRNDSKEYLISWSSDRNGYNWTSLSRTWVTINICLFDAGLTVLQNLNMHYKDNENRYFVSHIYQLNWYLYWSCFVNKLWYELLSNVIYWFRSN